MPRIVGIREKTDQMLYSAWIADTRPGGIGVSNEATFRNPMRLFTTDLGDKRRTNMRQSCTLGSDRTASIRKVGFHVSFSDQDNFDLVFKYQRGLNFDVSVGGSTVHSFNTGQKIDPAYRYGIRHLEPLDKPVDIGKTQSFFVELSSDKELEERMKLIERGTVEGYAEIKSIIDVMITREVQ